ncbi:MAG: 4-(cytidine 5'-diphospho)-2-C-methyl-D-erythritol kinase [Litorimonas sp.]
MGKQIRQLARAKVNLTLHVGALQNDGYHPVDSLVVFADIGDDLIFEPTAETSLTIDGADNLPTDGSNLILRAMEMIDCAPYHIHLVKNLPVSAGLGGGSANAAAVLRQFGAMVPNDNLAFNLGADIPVCQTSKTALMRGIGEEVTLLPLLGQLSAVLVNPGVAVSTGEIFNAMDSSPREKTPKANVASGDLLSRALAGVNDMQDFAVAQAPIILDVLRSLAQQSGCELARMSGSGATCFGIFRSDAQAAAAAQAISAAHTDWWVRSCRLGDA